MSAEREVVQALSTLVRAEVVISARVAGAVAGEAATEMMKKGVEPKRAEELAKAAARAFEGVETSLAVLAALRLFSDTLAVALEQFRRQEGEEPEPFVARVSAVSGVGPLEWARILDALAEEAD